MITNSDSRHSRIVFLDILRIFAFMSVLAGHKLYVQAFAIMEDEGVHATIKAVLGFLLHFISRGGAGVVVFFLISGYIITHVLQHERPGEFFIKRALRIYPLYVVALLMAYLYNYVVFDQTPEMAVFVPQLLLIGDFFDTPYALAGVEWTLRLEVGFYVYMGVLKSVGLVDRFRALLPWCLLLTTFLLVMLAPFPDGNYWGKGYFTIYGVFLLLGATCYLHERGWVGTQWLIGFTLLVLFQHYFMIVEYQPGLMRHHFATLAVVLFMICWRSRHVFRLTPLILLFSDLTYSVYLFHNWIWDPIKHALAKAKISFFYNDLQVLIFLFVFCYLMMRFVEKPAIRLGKRILSKRRAARNSDHLGSATNG